MLAIDDEMAEMRQPISWKPWQHDEPYADREEVIKEAVDVLHFVANIIVACGGTDEELNEYYLEKMERNRQRQLGGYNVKDAGVKCVTCSRAIDDVGHGVTVGVCAKCEPIDEVGEDA
jgi:dimeric dUTPase (all-alpha-NTP-PPase superfamily)